MSDYLKDFNDSPALTAREIQLDRAHAESIVEKCSPRAGTREVTVNGHTIYEVASDDIWAITIDGRELSHPLPSFNDVVETVEKITIPRPTNSDPEAWNKYFEHVEKAIEEFKKGMKT